MTDADANRPILRRGDREETAAGNYFVANYPPFSFWQRDQVPAALDRLDRPPAAGASFGLYVHLPFCRKRCHFCYFRVYTDNDAQRVRRYVEAVLAELRLYVERAFIGGRRPLFVYFGGGTPSYLSVDQLRQLFEGMQELLPWDGVEEVTFEAEPGTLQEKKVRALRELGVTRLSLGVENYDPDILALNNRAHRAAEIDRAYAWARDAGFPQINIDLIAGMLGETDANWAECVRRARAMQPESITIYQMEIPYNTTIYRRMKEGQEEIAPVADWRTKRRWVAEAFAQLEADGYAIGSAYTAVRDRSVRFLYRDGLWHGADMLGLGVASFSHFDGIHAQNHHDLDPYVEAAERGEIPLYRALQLDPEERMIRELVLQMKLGRVDTAYFHEKFGVDVKARFDDALQRHAASGDLRADNGHLQLSRDALLRVDPILHDFFLPRHRDARYA
ncbi:MAG: coproporphyrinogen-III oxidase family protein [Planctomycetota bacterium]